MSTVETLELVCERKICDLVSQENADRRWEASGVLAREGQCYVVFDNSPDIGRFSVDLQNCATNRLFTLEQKESNSGYEGIAYNSAQDRFYL